MVGSVNEFPMKTPTFCQKPCALQSMLSCLAVLLIKNKERRNLAVLLVVAIMLR
jgi:hypothetical protein